MSDSMVGASAEGTGGRLHLRRWTVTTGSGSERATGLRAAVALAAGDSQWGYRGERRPAFRGPCGARRGRGARLGRLVQPVTAILDHADRRFHQAG